MTRRTVKVIVLSSPPNQPFLEFSLIFDDGYEKHYHLDGYALRSMRGASEREIIIEQAHQYYEQNDEPAETISLIFL